jgi:hypothetical protein
VSERQVNSYVTLALGSKLPPSVSGLSFRFEPERLAATGMLDLDAVRDKLPKTGASTLLSFLGGTVPVKVKGRFQGASGQGQVVVEEAAVAGISLPPAMLSQIVAQATRSSKKPAGLRSARALPAALDGSQRPARGRARDRGVRARARPLGLGDPREGARYGLTSKSIACVTNPWAFLASASVTTTCRT